MSALDVFDGLTDEEFGALRPLVRPYGITRDQYREQLRTGRFSAGTFLNNLHVIRTVMATPEYHEQLRQVDNEIRRSRLRVINGGIS